MKDKPKLDFGTTKEEHGWFHYVYNWKTYAFYLALIVLGVFAFLDQGLIGIVYSTSILYGLKLLGKIF
jgi:hypothetical protein|tara:strand:+ start:200 stop:403 length:204 start_codon:yes stop_codon:yes gene_type:complete